MSAPAFSDEEFRLWSEWLAAEYGLAFGPQRRDLLRTRLEPRRAALGLESFEQLFFHLRYHPEAEAERQRLLPHLTNNESYFLRERGSLEVLRAEVLPALRARLGATGELRLLSAACAAGEEAYTLAAVARESGLFRWPSQVRVTGLDLDPAALERARAGCYGEHAFRGVEPAWRRAWFTERARCAEVRPALRAVTVFQQANLVQPGWWSALPPPQVIFCRNVLIYFSEPAVRCAAEALYAALAPGGYLFLGHAESLRHVPVPFTVERRPGALFYRKPEAPR